VTLLSGHLPPEIGRAMENSFVSLLYRLGYTVDRERDVESGLDAIARFYGEPLNPRTSYSCKLLLPSFAPKGLTAFSLKRGGIVNSDIAELVSKVQAAKTSKDKLLSSLESMIIATNFFKTESEIDDILTKDVHCWDGRRLIFYSAKARTAQELGQRGPVEEVAIEGLSKGSYLIETETSAESKNVIIANVAIFVDDHTKELIISSDHAKKILEYVYVKSLKGIVEYAHLDIQVPLEIHVLGIADEKLVRNAYSEYAVDKSLHPSVFFSAEPMIFQYGAAPWATLFSKRVFVP
jgi:hypothetical protein